VSERGPLSSSGSVQGERRSARDLALDRSRPSWRSWKTKSRHARCIRWIETYIVIPRGANAGKLAKLAPFQKHAIEELLAPGVRTGGLQIPRGNAKSTLWAAVGLWAACDHDDMPQVPITAYNSLQAGRTLFAPLSRMVELHPELSERCAVYSSTERKILSVWNRGEVIPLPADVERLQGLNPTVALVDEAETVDVDVFNALAQGAGKRSESLVLAIGTPAPEAQSRTLYVLREMGQAGKIPWVEYAADAGCAIDDRDQWRKANPAIEAGILFPDVLETELVTVDEVSFRSFRLGQWLDVSVTSWLPPGAWDDLPYAEPPPETAEIVLGLAGTYTSSIALVGATLDGAVFLAWGADTADDEELDAKVEAAFLRWNVLELVVAPRIRSGLVRRWTDLGLPVTVWPSARGDLDVASSTDFRRAIVEGRIAHDHDPLLAAHVGAVVGRANPDGSLRLDAPDDGREVDAARAARLAWFRAQEQSEQPVPMIF